jgi:hypothetical protein
MKEYPSIPRVTISPDIENGYAFLKMDGSGLRFLWNRKKDWCRYGTRHRLFDKSDPVFGEAIEIFNKKYAQHIKKVMIDLYGARECVAFCEFFGPNSFAGHHDPMDKKDLILFDINVYQKGILGPEEFLNVFDDQAGLEVAQLNYRGKIDQIFIDKVRQGIYNRPGEEGLVCKWGESHTLRMMKIKTREYLRLLKERFGDEDYSKIT